MIVETYGHRTPNSSLPFVVTCPRMETQVPAADIIRRKIEDHVAKKDLRAAVVQCEELEILVGLAKQRC